VSVAEAVYTKQLADVVRVELVGLLLIDMGSHEEEEVHLALGTLERDAHVLDLMGHCVRAGPEVVMQSVVQLVTESFCRTASVFKRAMRASRRLTLTRADSARRV
jgi:hypothetical protein